MAQSTSPFVQAVPSQRLTVIYDPLPTPARGHNVPLSFYQSDGTTANTDYDGETFKLVFGNDTDPDLFTVSAAISGSEGTFVLSAAQAVLCASDAVQRAYLVADISGVSVNLWGGPVSALPIGAATSGFNTSLTVTAGTAGQPATIGVASAVGLPGADGSIADAWEGPWDPDTIYAASKLVYHVYDGKGSTWRSNAITTAGEEPGVSAKWDLFAQGGDDGDNGAAATVAVGTVTTGAPGSSATVTNVGTSGAAVFDFSIPEGDPGTDGNDGWSPVFAVVSDGTRRVLQVSDWAGGEGTKPTTGLYVGASGLTATIGDAVDIRGAAGAAATIAVGTTSTLSPGESATVTNVGTSGAAVFDFGIPEGDPGADGAVWYTGAGAPSDGTGANGDLYLDTATSDVYQKAAGTWGSAVANIQGDAGADGKTVLNGSGAPGSGTGSDGDFYIDTAADTIYGPKASGAWPSGVSLVGPQGPAGPYNIAASFETDGDVYYLHGTADTFTLAGQSTTGTGTPTVQIDTGSGFGAVSYPQTVDQGDVIKISAASVSGYFAITLYQSSS